MSLIIKSRFIVVLLLSRLYQGNLLFLVDHRNPSIRAHLVRSIERINTALKITTLLDNINFQRSEVNTGPRQFLAAR